MSEWLMREHETTPENHAERAGAGEATRHFAWICDGCVLVTRTPYHPRVTDLIDAWPLEGPDDPASVDGELELRGFRRIGEWAPTLLGPSLGADEHVHPCAVVVESEDHDPNELT